MPLASDVDAPQAVGILRSEPQTAVRIEPPAPDTSASAKRRVDAIGSEPETLLERHGVKAAIIMPEDS